MALNGICCLKDMKQFGKLHELGPKSFDKNGGAIMNEKPIKIIVSAALVITATICFVHNAYSL